MGRRGPYVALLTLLLLCCGGAGVSGARSRVEKLLTGLQGSGEASGGQPEMALMMWNTGTMAARGAADAADAFDRWCREGGIESVSEYAITDAYREEGSEPPAVIVAGTVDGRRFDMRVVKRQPIQWVRKPSGG
jgi:hypothetical protein